jgi:hypothetical protein
LTKLTLRNIYAYVTRKLTCSNSQGNYAISNLLEDSMVTSFKEVFMMSASEIGNSRVGRGKYEASDSPFLRRGRKSTQTRRSQREFNMGRRNLWASVFGSQRRNICAPQVSIPNKGIVIFNKVRRISAFDDATSTLLISPAKQRAFIFYIVSHVKCYRCKLLRKRVKFLLQCLKTTPISPRVRQHPLAREKESLTPAGLTL